MEAAASVVGIVSFGLGLAKSLQAFIDSIIEAGETITLIVADVNHTASTLQRLQDMIDQDKAASKEEHRATVFNDIGIKEVAACAVQCKRIYVKIIILIEKASMQNGEDGTKNAASQGPAADDPDAPAMRLAAFSKNTTKLGRKMRWPWLEPRIKRLQEHLKDLKLSLSVSLQVFLIAQNRSRPSVARIFGTDEETELREMAEMLRKKLTELRAKKSSPNQPNRQPPGSDNETSVGINATRSTSTSSSIVIGSSRVTSSHNSVSSTTSSATSSLGSDRGQSSVRSRRPRVFRAMKGLRAFKFHIQKRAERTSVFKKDLTSVTFEAYLIYPDSLALANPFRGESPSAPPIKLPFGHRRLNREVKRALKAWSPWDIFLVLSPHDRAQVDRLTQQVQLEANGITNVCLVAINVVRTIDAGASDSNLCLKGDLEGGFKSFGLEWTRMVLFFRHEPVQVREGTTKAGIDGIGGRPLLSTTIRNIFRGSRKRIKKRLELEERLKREREETIRVGEKKGHQELKVKVETEIAKRDEETIKRQKEERRSQQKQIEHDKKVADEARSQLLETQRQEEEDKRRRQEEREELEEKIRNELKLEEGMAREEKQDGAGKEKDVVESADQALKGAEAVLEHIKKDIREGEPNMSEAERVKKTLEHELAKMRAKEAKEVAEKAKPPVKFKDAVGRNFSFPFHLVQTWRGMENLIKQAFLHLEVLGPHVQEGHYDLIDSKEQIILPSLWSATIEPGETVSMRMWPIDRYPLPGPPPNMTPEQRTHFHMSQQRQRAAAAAAAQGGYLGHASLPHHSGRAPPMRPPGLPGGIPFGAQPPPPPGRGPFGPPGGEGRRPAAMVEVVEGGRPKKDKGKKAKTSLRFFSGSKPSKKRSKGKHSHSKANALEVHDDEGLKDTGKDEDMEDIDKELGMDDLEGAEEVAAKNVDELLETWTNVPADT